MRDINVVAFPLQARPNAKTLMSLSFSKYSFGPVHPPLETECIVRIPQDPVGRWTSHPSPAIAVACHAKRTE